jgi:hypothetical protein
MDLESERRCIQHCLDFGIKLVWITHRKHPEFDHETSYVLFR